MYLDYKGCRTVPFLHFLNINFWQKAFTKLHLVCHEFDPPSFETMLKKLQKWYHAVSLMATVKWSQVKSWPNISDEARFSLSALSITLEAHYSSSLPLLPLMLLSLYLILFLSMVPPPSGLRRSSFFLTSGKESTLCQLYFLYSASHNLNWTKYENNL